MGHEKTLAAALQLQHDAGLILSNLQVLQQFVTSLNRTSSDGGEPSGDTWGGNHFVSGRSTERYYSYLVGVVNLTEL